ncbi:5-deoxy-glucuronate isomerase [Arsenicicoccus piscis]|uniref:5-deoxy-glucuronate isomerase n=1 Tax=Arsenicicoccus piscis TaxID=673954 RepID=UPI001F4CADDB|nr:5-deoxy-glucuronate isomerase [Arsenicicoccus piscis]MCH8627458.1 5-deoxy-glucuronate isomerase [Arsenicicoccus piscis]
MNDWIKPAGSTGDDDYDVRITPGETAGWAHTGLLVTDLDAGESRTVATGDCEWIVLPLSGADLTVRSGDDEVTLGGRASVFDGATDIAYVGRDSEFTITATSPVRVALPSAKAATAKPFAVVRAADVPVEMRGAGSCSRQVQNFGTPDTLDADSIIACEVITPAGNWSSYPPHKHDVDRPGEETSLEEIYYFEVRTQPGGAGTDPVAWQAAYGTEDRPLEINTAVRPGDTVLIPHGWHGPSMAAPGYDLYYLNVMAGPGDERIWLICDDPAHTWVRSTWEDQPVDARLPFPAK